MNSKLSIFYLVVLALSWNNAKALDDADTSKILEIVLPAISDCSVEYPIKDGVILEVAQTGQLTSLDSCFVGCVLKKIDIIDSDGKFNPDKVLEIIKNNSFNAEDVEHAKDVVSKCTDKNNESVSDGAKGCERAKLLVDCFSNFRQLFFP